ncbi:hypothetical protein BLNAU_19272 [Blattamonas nauphoetae]|uniref:Uncharacterized protein n=1 Tax=Blattamonas nauphoetae TaxID=2049346 RepID=A0ABQ9X201_9EUKA|nr:hypothetical protein BLNAU_19272 [Blattamonas nauphoetae]
MVSDISPVSDRQYFSVKTDRSVPVRQAYVKLRRKYCEDLKYLPCPMTKKESGSILAIVTFIQIVLLFLVVLQDRTGRTCGPKPIDLV